MPRLVDGRFEVTCTLIVDPWRRGPVPVRPHTGLARSSRARSRTVPVVDEAERAILIEAGLRTERDRAAGAGPARCPTLVSGRPGDDFNERGDVRALCCVATAGSWCAPATNE